MMSRRLGLLLAACWLAAVPAGSRGQEVLVKADTLSLRDKPDTKAKRLDTLKTHEPIQIRNRKGEWAQVETRTGVVGWVLASYLSPSCFVSVSTDTLNIRRGPGTNYSVIMRVARNYPVRVVDRTEDWLLVSDYDGDRGWVSAAMVAFTPYVITRVEKCNVRQGPGTESRIAFTAERGVLFKVLESKQGWLHVRHADGDEGWVSPKVVFGWIDADGSDEGKT